MMVACILHDGRLMCSHRRHKLLSLSLRLAVAGCLLLVASCAWQRPRSQSSFDEWNLTPGQRDSLNQLLTEHQTLKDENNRLRKHIKTQNLDRVKMSAEIEYRVERNQYLEHALTEAHTDLAKVEKQFISIENQLQTSDTKASAVAVLAEVKLRYDNILKVDSIRPDSVTIKEIAHKLEESEQLLQKKNFSAAAYYAKRADRLIQISQHQNKLVYSNGETRIVSVSKANLRLGPGTNHEVITNLKFGTVLIQIDQSDDWSKIRTRDGDEGWILTALLR